MSNVEGIVLKQLLTIDSREQALEAFSKLKEKYFSASFSSLYKNITDFYDIKGHIPSTDELKIFRARDIKTTTAISSIELIDDSEVEIDLVVDALIDQYAQNLTLDLMSDTITAMPVMNRYELQDKLAEIPMLLDEELDDNEKVFTVKELSTFTKPEYTDYLQVSSGISNLWDSSIAYQRQELGLIGGKRGSGKSIICANITSHQMDIGNIGAYFTIEMTGAETFQRVISIRSKVSAENIRKNNLSEEEIRKMAKATADMYVNGDVVYDKHFVQNTTAPDRYEFEQELKSTCDIAEEGRLIIVDDRELSISTIDTQINKLKAKYGDKLQVVAIDYLNQVVMPGHTGLDMYDWKPQMVIAKQLKNLARKYDVFIVSPYQIAEDGTTRLAKGILDACDTAQIVEVHDKKIDKALSLITVKSRNGDDSLVCTVGMDWDILTINPAEVQLKSEEEKEQEKEETPFCVPDGAQEVI